MTTREPRALGFGATLRRDVRDLRALAEAVAVAAALSAAATGISLVVELEGRPGAIAVHMLAVLAAVALRGPLAGLAAAVASVVLADYYLLEPTGSLFRDAGGGTVDRDSLVAIVLLALSCGVASLVQTRQARIERRSRKLVRERDEARLAVVEVLDATNTGQWTWSLDTDEITWSDSLGPLHGYPRGWRPEGLETYRRLIHPDDWDALAERIQDAVAAGTGYEAEFRTLWPDGSDRWLWTKADRLGPRLVGITRDVTDRRRREEAELRLLREREEAARRAQALQSVTSQLSGAASSSEVLDIAIREGLATIGAWGGAVGVVNREGTAFRRITSGYALREDGLWDEVPVDADAPGPVAFRTGAPVWVETREEVDRRFPLLAQIMGTSDFEAVCALPLSVAGERIGFFAAVFAEPRAFEEADRGFVVAVVRQCALALERSLLLDAERTAVDRLRRLQRITERLAGVPTMTRVADVVVGDAISALGAAAGALVVARDDGLLQTLAAVGYGDDRFPLKRPFPLDADLVVARVARSRLPLWVDSIDQIRATYPSEELARGIQVESEAYVPMVVRGELLGVLVVGFAGQHALSSDEKELLVTLGRLCAQALEAAARHERQLKVAETLQHSLLPQSLPVREELRTAVRYLPGSTEADVGGDWFDLVARKDGRIGGTVGDVGGKGVQAASRMGQMRIAARAYWVEGASPAEVLTRLNDLMEATEPTFTTLVGFDLDPASGVFRYCSGGHPHPVLLRAGRGSFLDAAACLPIGVGAPSMYGDAAIGLEPGDIVLLYTDGLVERRDASLDEQLGRLLHVVEAGGGMAPEPLVEHVLDAFFSGATRRDDVVVVALQFVGSGALLERATPGRPAAVAGDPAEPVGEPG